MRKNLIQLTTLVTLFLSSSTLFAGPLIQHFMYNDSVATRIQSPAGDYLAVGSCVTTQGLNSENDQIVCGKTEHNGVSFFDADSFYGDNISIKVGNTEAAPDAEIRWDTSLATHTLLINHPQARTTFGYGLRTKQTSGDLVAGNALFGTSHIFTPSASDDSTAAYIGYEVDLSGGWNTPAALFINYISGTQAGNGNFYGNFLNATASGSGDIAFANGGLTHSGTGDAAYIDGAVIHSGGTGSVYGIKLNVANTTSAVAGMTGVDITLTPNVAGVLPTGFIARNAGSQTAQNLLGLTGNWAQGINLTGGNIANEAIVLDSGTITFDDYDSQINNSRITVGDGNKMSIFSSDGFAAAAEARNGGIVQIYGGLPANAGIPGYVKIGQSAGTPDHLSSRDDFYVKGDSEYDGVAWFDGTIRAASSIVGGSSSLTWSLFIGGSGSNAGLIRSNPSFDQMIFAVGSEYGRQLILTDYANMNLDHDRPTSTDPVFLIFSATSPDIDNDEWVSFSHNKVDARIDTGKGGIDFNGTASISAAGSLSLGGLLNLLTGGNIISTSNGSIAVIPDGTGNFIIDGELTLTPSTDISLSSGDTLTNTHAIQRVVGNGGAVTLTSTPNIADGQDGQCVRIFGTSAANTVEFQDEDNLASSGLALNGDVNVVLGLGDNFEVCYDLADDIWRETHRALNIDD